MSRPFSCKNVRSSIVIHIYCQRFLFQIFKNITENVKIWPKYDLLWSGLEIWPKYNHFLKIVIIMTTGHNIMTSGNPESVNTTKGLPMNLADFDLCFNHIVLYFIYQIWTSCKAQVTHTFLCSRGRKFIKKTIFGVRYLGLSKHCHLS